MGDMTGQIWADGREVDNLSVAEPEYHFEYVAIHNQRIALVKNYTTWYVVGLTVSMAVFWMFLWAGLTSANLPLLIFGGLVSSGFVWMAHGVSCSIDSGVIALYPRIIFLEIILDYQFYRDYLRRRPRGESERRFIEKCENISVPNTAQLWREIHTDFNSKDFPRSRRIHRHYRWMAFGSVLVYWFTIAATVLNTFTDITR